MNKEIEEKIGILVGKVSMCWVPIPTGVFDSTEVVKILDEIQSLIDSEVEKQTKLLNDELHDNVYYIANLKQEIEGFGGRVKEIKQSYYEAYADTIKIKTDEFEVEKKRYAMEVKGAMPSYEDRFEVAIVSAVEGIIPVYPQETINTVNRIIEAIDKLYRDRLGVK